MYTNENETQTERLERLRDETAQRAKAASPESLPVRPADVIHSVRTGTTISIGEGFMSAGHVTVAGENIIVTANMIAASYDNFDRSWLAIIDDDAAQMERWGGSQIQNRASPRGRADLERARGFRLGSAARSRSPCRVAAARRTGTRRGDGGGAREVRASADHERHSESQRRSDCPGGRGAAAPVG